MRHNFDEQLQISEFIKDPASLKLLILAGTNIRPNQIMTVNKCTSLIKLDLSSNQLLELPLRFANFQQMRILYLHDNQLSNVSISKTNLQYVSLFDNPIRDYRMQLVQNNQKLLAIDHYVITKAERLLKTLPAQNCLLKWPIVEISQSLQHEEDYLNLLKAELFVINQVHKRATSTNIIGKYMFSLAKSIQFARLRHTVTYESFFLIETVKNAAKKWIEFTQRKRKLRKLLQGTPGQKYLQNKIQRILTNRSPGVARVMERFIKNIRQMMDARKILQSAFEQYRLNIPVFDQISKLFMQTSLKLYFRQSQIYSLQKILLYARKLFFSRKMYDLCDNFDKLVVRTKKTYFIFRQKPKQTQTFLLHMIKNNMNLVIGEKGLDRRNVLYNRRGHKEIQIKRVKGPSVKVDREKMLKTEQRIDRLYRRYDNLIQFQFKNQAMFIAILRLIRFFNAGNSNVILQNQAAYFQTEVVFQDKQQKKNKEKLTICSYQLTQRMISANIIQKWWRRMKCKITCDINILKQIKVARAHKLIGKWLRDLTFRHRIQLNKTHSFTKTTAKDFQLYMQLNIYMNLPAPTNLLRFKIQYPSESQYLYRILHKKTQSQIIEMGGRSWIKLKFNDANQTYQAQKILSILTYRYYHNGTYVKLFSFNQINSKKELQNYQKKIQKCFSIKISVTASENSNKISKKIQIDNPQPYFIWPLLQQGYGSIFKSQDIQSLLISVFIYNKNRRPLKVNCDLLWTTPSTIYHYRKKMKSQVRIRTPKKQKMMADPAIEHYLALPHIRHKLNRERNSSVKQHKSLLQANRQKGHSQHIQLSLLSQTLNIKRS